MGDAAPPAQASSAELTEGDHLATEAPSTDLAGDEAHVDQPTAALSSPGVLTPEANMVAPIDEIEREIEEASQILPIESLALEDDSPESAPPAIVAPAIVPPRIRAPHVDAPDLNPPPVLSPPPVPVAAKEPLEITLEPVSRPAHDPPKGDPESP